MRVRQEEKGAKRGTTGGIEKEWKDRGILQLKYAKYAQINAVRSLLIFFNILFPNIPDLLVRPPVNAVIFTPENFQTSPNYFSHYYVF